MKKAELIPLFELIVQEEKTNGNKITKEYIANELEISIEQVRRYFRGASFPPVPTLYLIADLLNRRVDQLYKKKDG